MDVPDSSESFDSDVAESHTDRATDSPEAVLREMRPWDLERVERAIVSDAVAKDLLAHGAPPDLAMTAMDNPYNGLSREEIVERYWDAERNMWKWPNHDGFLAGIYETARAFPAELRFDRIGLVTDWTGDFLSSAGDSYPARALAPGTSGDYHVFVGTGRPLPSDWELRFGPAGPAFDQPGGSTQWVVVDHEGEHVLIEQLVVEGYLKRVTPSP
jgi:hypothetical protein